MAPLIAPATARRSERPRVVVACALASAVVGATGVAFLVGMFVAFAGGARTLGMTLGAINDGLGLVSYALIVPVIVVLRRRLRPVAPLAVDLATVAGLAASAAIVTLQALLIRGVLTFEEQIGMVAIAFLVFDVWLVVIGWAGGRSGLLPGGARMGLVGATYIGYPAWALWVARRLAADAIIAPTGPPAA